MLGVIFIGCLLLPKLDVGGSSVPAFLRDILRSLFFCAMTVLHVRPRLTEYRFGYRFALRIPRSNAKEGDKMRQFAKQIESGNILKTKDFQAFRRPRNLVC